LTVTANNASRVYGAANPTLTYAITGYVNGDTSSVVSGTATETTAATTSSADGTYPITFATESLTAANYTFSYVNGTLTVSGAPQTVTFTPLPSTVTYGVSPIALSASASSGLAVTFSVVSGPGTIFDSILTITGGGTVVVAADQAGNADYAPATQVTQTMVVNQATPTNYSYTVGYDPVGNVANFNDSVMGTWSFNYDSLKPPNERPNTAVTSTSTQYTGMNLCWAYDSFGNRIMQIFQSAACPAAPTPGQSPATVYYNPNNQVTFVSQSAPSVISARMDSHTTERVTCSRTIRTPTSTTPKAASARSKAPRWRASHR